MILLTVNAANAFAPPVIYLHSLSHPFDIIDKSNFNVASTYLLTLYRIQITDANTVCDTVVFSVCSLKTIAFSGCIYDCIMYDCVKC
mmetsp:Transcript_59349/g.70787  ORF Transcript_59349/g.70787 Transcript_59349/m.70787 type:complete len:87 (-) Transcript_59349:895-1155(-)